MKETGEFKFRDVFFLNTSSTDLRSQNLTFSFSNHALEWNKNDADYKAPEETLHWQRTMETLQKYIPAPTQEWEFKVLSIFTTKPIKELKEVFEAMQDIKKRNQK